MPAVRHAQHGQNHGRPRAAVDRREPAAADVVVSSTLGVWVRGRQPGLPACPPNFGGLVLGCIEADFCNQVLILQDFSRSTRFSILCTDQISKFQQKIVKLFGGMKKIMSFHSRFSMNFQFLRFFFLNFNKFCRNFTEMFRK